MKKEQENENGTKLSEVLICLGLLAAATVLGFLCKDLGLSETTIITFYLLSVFLSAIMTTGRILNVFMAVISVFTYNFLFVEPKYTLLAYDPNYPVTFIVILIVAIMTGRLVLKLKRTAMDYERASHYNEVMLETSHILNKAATSEEVISIACSQIKKLIKSEKEIRYYREIPEDNKTVKCYPIKLRDRIYGYMAVDSELITSNPDFEVLIRAVIDECALIMENHRIAEEKEEEKIKTKNEQFRADLLRSISHDLRTPLTSISGNSVNLIQGADSIDQATRDQIYADIYDDSQYLTGLVENILSISKLQYGKMYLKLNTEILEDVVNESLHHIDRNSEDHHITTEFPDEIILVNMDVQLIMQVIINIVNNAVKYTPKGSHINIKAQIEGRYAVVDISDDGPGMSMEDKARVFETFYNGKKDIADHKRSMGLGLPLCKSIIEAHNGSIEVRDNIPKGTVVSFSLPNREVKRSDG